MTPTINIYRADGTVLMEAVVTKDAAARESLMTEDCIELRWSAAGYSVLPEGAYITDDAGERYRLLRPYYPSQKNELRCDYSPEFLSRVMCWSAVPLFFYTYAADGVTITSREAEWSLTATPATFMSYLARVIEAETGERWTVTVSDDIKQTTASVTFQSTDVLSGLNAIASAFGTEWRADKKSNTLHLGAASYGDPIRLEVGNNVGVPSTTASREEYGNRYYVLGSSRNITQSYEGANVNNLVTRRLTLDPDKYPGGYIDTRPGLTKSEIVPRYLTFDNIYPRSALVAYDVRCRLVYRMNESSDKIQIGATATGDPIYDQYAIWYFKAKDKTTGKQYLFDSADLIERQTLSVSFLGGALTGRDFELTYHDSAKVVNTSDGTPLQVDKGDFEINFVEEGGYIIPAVTALVPADGDALTLFNIKMPTEYHASAYLELEAAALKEINRRNRDLNNYEVQSNAVMFYDDDPGLTVGRKVVFVNVDGQEVFTRVLSIVRKLDRPCEQTITLGNEVVKGAMSEIKDNVVNANTNLAVISQLQELNTAFTQAYTRAQQQMIEGFARMSQIWKLDEDGNVYTERNVYSYGDMVSGGKSDGLGGAGGVGGALNLFDLLDVELSDRVNGDLIAWNGAKWTNIRWSDIKPDLTGYATEAWVKSQGYLTQHQSLAGYATQTWVEGKGYALASDLGGYLPLTGGTLTGPLTMGGDASHRIYFKDADHFIELDEDGNFHFSHNVYSDGDMVSGGWQTPGEGGAPVVGALSDLTDVQLAGLAVGDLIQWNGTDWVNVKASELGIGMSVDLSNVMCGVSLDKTGDFDADALSDQYVIYDPTGDMRNGSGAWTHFPGVKPNGGFTLINLKEGIYKKQLYTEYDSNRLYIRNEHWDAATSGHVWSAWDSFALMSDLGKYVTLDTTQTITGAKTFSATLRTTSFAQIGVGKTHYIQMGGGSNGYVWIDCVQNNVMVNNIMMYPTYTYFGKNIKAPAFVKDGGTSSQFLKADGSVDGNTYLTSHQSLDYINVLDTRDTATTTTNSRRLTAHFKRNNAISLSDGGDFAGLLHLQPWGDASGGSAYELVFTVNGNLWMRSGAIGSAWGGWRKFLNTGNIGLAPNATFSSYVAAIGCRIAVRFGDTNSYGAMRPYDTVLDVGNGSYARFFRLMHNRQDGNLRFQGSTNADSTSTAAWGTERTLLDTVNYAGLIDARYVKKAGDTMTGNLTLPRLNITGTASSTAYLTSDSSSNCFFNINNKSLLVLESTSSINAIRSSRALGGTVSLGDSTTRWSNVYSVSGDFSGVLTALRIVTTGENRFSIGEYADPTVGISSALKINGVLSQSGGNVLLCTKSGNVGIGTTSPAYKLDVTGTIYATNAITCTYIGMSNSTTNPYLVMVLNNRRWYAQLYQDRMYLGVGVDKGVYIDINGNLFSPGDQVSASSSDRRLKQRFAVEDYTARIMRLGAVMDYEWSDKARALDPGKYDAVRHSSVVWQRACKVGIPGFCGVDGRGYGFVNWLNKDYQASLLGAVQETIRTVRRHDDEIRQLHRHIGELEVIVNNKCA